MTTPNTLQFPKVTFLFQGIGGGICTFLAPLANSYASVMVTWVVTSFFIAWLISQEPIVIGASIDSPGKFPSALGLARFMRGLFSIFGSLTASKFFKYLTYYNADKHSRQFILITYHCLLSANL